MSTVLAIMLVALLRIGDLGKTQPLSRAREIECARVLRVLALTDHGFRFIASVTVASACVTGALPSRS